MSLLAVSGYQLLHSSINKWFSLDAIAALLVYRTKEKRVFAVFDLISMQNISHNLLLFCATTWSSYHVIENHLLAPRTMEPDCYVH